MPRYHLNIRDRGMYVSDVEGGEFDGIEAARMEAITSAREIMSNQVLAGKAPNGSVFEITDVNGVTVLTIPFKDALARPSI